MTKNNTSENGGTDTLKQGKIYCVFSGCGKTQANQWSLCVDLEQHYYQKDVDIDKVIDIALMIVETGRHVAMSYSLTMRKRLQERGIEYTAILPHESDVEVYRNRYIDSKKPKEHIDYICGNWHDLRNNTLDNETVYTLPHCGYFDRYLNGRYNTRTNTNAKTADTL
jgi:hypothetical protein